MSNAMRIVRSGWAAGPVAAAARAVTERKGPHRLQLVQAMAATPAPAETAVEEAVAQPAPEVELAFYRKYTEAVLSRYLRLSMETGRVPSLLGQEMFRGHVTRGRVKSFEDVVIFVHDIEGCLKQLEPSQQYLMRKIALQGHTQEEVAATTGMSLRTVIRRYWESLDAMTKLLLDRRLMEPALTGGQL